LKANIHRWLTQIEKNTDQIESKTKQLFSACESIVTQANQKGVFLDFTTITSDPNALSLLVTVLSNNGNSFFLN